MEGYLLPSEQESFLHSRAPQMLSFPEFVLLSLNIKTAHSQLLQRFVGLVLLELHELSSRASSQSGNNFSRAVQ